MVLSHSTREGDSQSGEQLPKVCFVSSLWYANWVHTRYAFIPRNIFTVTTSIWRTLGSLGRVADIESHDHAATERWMGKMSCRVVVASALDLTQVQALSLSSYLPFLVSCSSPYEKSNTPRSTFLLLTEGFRSLTTLFLANNQTIQTRQLLALPLYKIEELSLL